MDDATVSNVSHGTTQLASGVTIRPEEAAHFGSLAADWWDPEGSSAMLHRLNPVRLRFLRDAVDMHWGGDVETTRPLDGKRALDVGCGAGLLCEPLRRMGAEVTGVDASAQNIAAAMAHAEGGGLDIDYRAGELGSLGLGTFDLVASLEVIEHVADKQRFMAQLVGHLAPDGLVVLSTPNRTARSRMLMVEGAELLGLIPRGTHDWSDFLTPEELTDLCEIVGLTVTSTQGIGFSPTRGLHLSDDLALNYIMTARRRSIPTL